MIYIVLDSKIRMLLIGDPQIEGNVEGFAPYSTYYLKTCEILVNIAIEGSRSRRKVD